MTTIKYKGMELEEYLSDKPVVFDPPKRSICVDEVGRMECDVVAFIPGIRTPVICTDSTAWLHFAILPEKSAPRIATNRELAKWLAQGKGEWCNCIGDNQRAAIEWWYDQGYSKKAAKNVFVRKWEDTEWHVPTVEYMGITEVKTYEDVVKREG